MKKLILATFAIATVTFAANEVTGQLKLTGKRAEDVHKALVAIYKVDEKLVSVSHKFQGPEYSSMKVGSILIKCQDGGKEENSCSISVE